MASQPRCACVGCRNGFYDCSSPRHGGSGRDEHRSTPGKADKRNYGRIVEQTWIWSIVGYSLLRFFIAWGAFSEHGANIWVFGLIDVGTAWPYAKSVSTVCKRAAGSQWRSLPVPLVVALGTFFAPYAYLWFAAGEMPGDVRLGMIICVSVLLVAASAGVLTKSRKLRTEGRGTTIDLADDAEIVIDLTDSAQAVIMVAGRGTTPVSPGASSADADELIIDLTTKADGSDRTVING